MKTLLFRLCLLLPFPYPCPAATAYQPHANPVRVTSVTTEWTDAKRNRKVPAKIYFPASLPAASPVVIFSHGLGGSREDYAYLGQYWASCGYITVHLQHLGSDSTLWQDTGNFLEA